MSWQAYFESVGDVWVIWAVSLLALTWLAAHAMRTLRWSHVKDLLRGEEGASYALPYVMTFPVYLMLVCLMIQATLILMVKMGSVYAAYAATRAAIVWRSNEPDAADPATAEEETRKRARLAAVYALAPFASSAEPHQRLLGPGVLSYDLLDWVDARDWMYWEAYQYFSRDDGAPQDYVRTKYRFANRNTWISEIDFGNNKWNEDVKVTVTYQMPMSIPGAGRILGGPGAWRFYARLIETTVALPNESPDTGDRTDHKRSRLGINYRSNRLEFW